MTKEMKTSKKFLAMLSLVTAGLCIFTTELALAGAPLYPNAPSPDARYPEYDERVSISTSLTMGPNSVLFWKKIQAIIADQDYLLDFSKLKNLLDLEIKQPVDAVSPNKTGRQSREDATDRPMMLKATAYRIYPNQKNSKAKDVFLELDLDIEQICLTGSEVERVFGRGSIGFSSHNPYRYDSRGLPLESASGESYPTDRASPRDFSVAFSYARSGCVKAILFSKTIEN